VAELVRGKVLASAWPDTVLTLVFNHHNHPNLLLRFVLGLASDRFVRKVFFSPLLLKNKHGSMKRKEKEGKKEEQRSVFARPSKLFFSSQQSLFRKEETYFFARPNTHPKKDLSSFFQRPTTRPT